MRIACVRLAAVCITLFALGSDALYAETSSERRIEELKRETLAQTESVAPEVLPEAKPLETIDVIFLALLQTRKVTFHYDICKVLVILKGLENELFDATAQAAFLEEQNMIPPRLLGRFDPQAPLRRSVAAYMFCRALGIRGGAIGTLMGLNERYAMKELVFKGIMASGNANDIISGEELVSMTNRAGEYAAKHTK